MMGEKSIPVFVTKRLQVRTAVTTDAPMYYNLWTNRDVMRNVGFPQGLPITQKEIEQKIYQQQHKDEFEHLLVVVLKATGETIGECFMHLPNEAGVAGTDVKLLPDYWGHKYGVEVKRGLLDYLFTHTTCTAVRATPHVKNIASIKMQEAVGGVRIGEEITEFPEAMKAFTTPVHYYLYHVYRADWEKQRIDKLD